MIDVGQAVGTGAAIWHMMTYWYAPADVFVPYCWHDRTIGPFGDRPCKLPTGHNGPCDRPGSSGISNFRKVINHLG